jgi:hypothetical protein
VRKLILCALLTVLPTKAKADFWGADLPLLAEIVFNTLNTMMQLQEQTNFWESQMKGIDDRIVRMRTISELVQPSDWSQWKNPDEALRRLQKIYQTLPKQYRSEKTDELERELAKALNMAANMSGETKATFDSGKELERRGADVSPAVAQKLTASGVGSLIALESQTQAIQSKIMSLMAQSIAEASEKETRTLIARGSSLQSISLQLSPLKKTFSSLVLGIKQVGF